MSHEGAAIQPSVGIDNGDSLGVEHHIEQVGIALANCLLVQEHVVWLVAYVAVGIFHVLVYVVENLDIFLGVVCTSYNQFVGKGLNFLVLLVGGNLEVAHSYRECAVGTLQYVEEFLGRHARQGLCTVVLGEGTGKVGRRLFCGFVRDDVACAVDVV